MSHQKYYCCSPLSAFLVLFSRKRAFIHVESVLVSQSCPTLCNPVDCSLPGSSVYGVLQQEYWSGLPSPSPGNLPDLGIKPISLASSVL